MTSDGHSEQRTYRSECTTTGCEWSCEHDWYGTVEKKALAHMDDRGHSATQPEVSE